MKVVDSTSTINWYNNNAVQYAANIQPYISPDLIRTFTNYLNGKKILDAGCAAGRDTEYFYHQGYEVTGIDLSEPLLSIARQNEPGIDYMQGDFRHLPFQDNLFDGVWSNASLVHMDTLDDTELALKEFYRVLKKGGTLFTMVKTSSKSTDVVADALSGHERFFRYYTKVQFENLLSKNHFIIIDSKYHDDPAGRLDVTWLVIFSRK